MNLYKQELYHHGILGQKWGRMQGPPYPLGSGDHSALEKKEGYKKSLGGGRNEKLYDRHEKSSNTKPEKKKREPGKIKKKLTENYSKYYQRKYKLTKEEADEEAEKRYDTTKKIAIGLGVTAAAATAIYAYRKIGRAYVDEVIKPDTVIQNLTYSPDYIDKNKAFYGSYRKLDDFKYLGGFAKQQDMFGRPVGNFKKKVNVNTADSIKVAGKFNAEKVFKELLKNPEFAKAAGTRSYNDFNQKGLLAGSGKDKAVDMFYDALKNKGYGAVRDVNDSLLSGFNTKATIFFDKDKLQKAGGVISKQVSDIDPNEYAKARALFNPIVYADALATPGNVMIGSTWVAGAIAASHDNKVKKKYSKKGRNNVKSN